MLLNFFSDHSFSITFISTVLTIFLLIYNIQFASWFYVAKFTLFMIIRFVDYKPKKWHYFLTEFCYFANAMLVIYIILHSIGYNVTWLFRDIYGLAQGPLACATLFFGDKLVFHNIQHFISIFVHLAPLLVTTGIRWFDYDNYFGLESDISNNWWNECYKNFSSSIWIYILWAFVYYIFIFWLLEERIIEKDNMTLYKYVVKDNKITGNKKVDEIIYMIGHAIMNSLTIFMSGLFWNNELLNLCFVFIICSLGVIRAEAFYKKKLLKEKND